MEVERRIEEAQAILGALGLPSRQQNRMSALSLLALVDVKPGESWGVARTRLIGIDAIRQWIAMHYDVHYAPNTRETIRRQAIHYFVQAHVAVRNPDNPARATNDKNNAYAITDEALQVIRAFGTPGLEGAVESFRVLRGSLAEKYAAIEKLHRIPLVVNGKPYSLSPGQHNELQAAIVTSFGPHFFPGAEVLYLGDTAKKDLVLDAKRLTALGIPANEHDKLPDVVLHDSVRNWLCVVEAVTSHGPVSPKRYDELRSMLAQCRASVIYATAFLNSKTYQRYAADIAWRTEVWIAERPSHLIHYDGEKYLEPYDDRASSER